MAETLIINRSSVVVGLGSPAYTFTVPLTDMYSIRVDSTERPPSGVTIVIQDNGSTVFTAPVLGVAQGAVQFRYAALLTAAHVITVLITSSDLEDNELNTVKTTVSICQGL